MAKFFITGGTGFIGYTLAVHLTSLGHEVIVLSRTEQSVELMGAHARVVVGDPLKPGPWWDEVASCDCAVNLAGERITGRWDAKLKSEIRDSRILTTKNLVAAIPEGKPFTLFSASGVGIYGDAGDAELTEDSPLGDDFLARVAKDWEAEALTAKAKGARVIIGRFGYALGRDGGLLMEIFRNAKSFFGGSVGTGEQWLSWIHIEDLVDAVTSLILSTDAEGVYNICAPTPARQKELAVAVRKMVRSRIALNLTPLMLKAVLGEFAEYLFHSQRMFPKRLLERGFSPRYPDLGENVKKLLW